MNYWEEAVSQAADEAGVLLTKEQLDCMTVSIESAHEMYGEATGRLCIPDPAIAEKRLIDERHARELKAAANREDILTDEIARHLGVDPIRVHIHNGRVDVSRT